MKDKMEIPDFSKYPALNEFMNKKDKYILDENKNVIPANMIEWIQFSQKWDGIVKQEEINNYRISTTFIGIDCNFIFSDPCYKEHKPHIFETMVFVVGDHSDIYCYRYSTWQEAEEGHQKAVECVKNGCIQIYDWITNEK